MGAGGGDLQSQMLQAQQQLMSNPELMQQLMESPLMQNLLANPDTLQTMLTSNPQIQQLMEVCVCAHVRTCVHVCVDHVFSTAEESGADSCSPQPGADETGHGDGS